MATTSTTPRSEPPQLQPLAQRLKAWRASRTRGQRIPDELWKAAGELARVHGLSRTSAALKLSYYDLKRRLPSGRIQRRRPLTPAPFVEVAPPALAPGLAERGTLELVQASGARLTLRLPDASASDLLALVHLFLRHRS
jgi:hypothetical protein